MRTPAGVRTIRMSSRLGRTFRQTIQVRSGWRFCRPMVFVSFLFSLSNPGYVLLKRLLAQVGCLLTQQSNNLGSTLCENDVSFPSSYASFLVPSALAHLFLRKIQEHSPEHQYPRAT